MVNENNEYGLFQGLDQDFQRQVWRQRAKEDPKTQRWAHVFETMDPPDEELMTIAANLFHMVGHTVPPYKLLAVVTGIWTYGFAEAMSKLADEEITFASGLPLERFLLDAPQGQNVSN